MRRKSFKTANCGIARALEAIGDGWTVLILREAMLGINAFDDFVSALNIPRNTLSTKLDALIEHGIMSKQIDESDRRRSIYLLEEPGQDLWIVLLALQQWGNKWKFSDKGAPSYVADRRKHHPVKPLTAHASTGRELTYQDVTMIAGPSATNALIKRFNNLP